VHQATSGYYADSEPAFDPDGQYLYFFTERELSPVYSGLDATWIYPNSTRIAAVALREDVPSPLAPVRIPRPVDRRSPEALSRALSSRRSSGTSE